MPFQLKHYQRRCLDELGRYLRRTVELGQADVAFYEQMKRPYLDVKALPGLPYVCVRVPTGGGKTVMAAHAVGIAARELLRADRCLVLWLAPTTQIVEQTLKALRDKKHPYRQALDDAFGGCVTVMDLAAALGIGRSVQESDTVVIVSTLAAMRVENTDGRKVYEANGQLEECFQGLTAEQLANLNKIGGADATAPSLANLLAIRRPLVIVDEAHNARTHLSFETLARFSPACILEFTATPDQDVKGDPSNVLTHVSAAELKDEHMIKLPIRLKTRPQWKEAVQEAVAKQGELERIALEEEKATGEYVRPIVLFQAQRNVTGQQNVTFEVLKASLRTDFSIPEDQIAVATGGVNDLADVPILDRNQKIRFIITVDKLREGWDCPFAYVLCSVSNLTSTTAVEQILGRILRMPYARERQHEALNHAYAYATSQGFVDAANALTDALVESGFERFEARTMIRAETTALDFGPLFAQTVTEVVSSKPAVERLPQALREKVAVQVQGEQVAVEYKGPPMTDAEAAALKTAFEKDEDREAVERLCRKSRGEDASPAAMGKPLSVPALAVRVGEQLELFEDQFREAPWSLAACDPRLTEAEFAIKTGPGHVAEVDVDKEGKIGYHFMEDLERQLSLLDMRGPKTETELAVWVDRAIQHPDITHADASLFLRHMVDALIRERGFSLDQVVTYRFRLRDVAKEKINSHRRAAFEEAYQQMLLPDATTPLEASPAIVFTFPLNAYPAPRLYSGPIRFRKHYYDNVADMNDEEAACAAIIDSLPEVEYWVRNLERDRYSFWLPTPTDKFYPDFVAKLRDGRYLVVEYKGALWSDTADTREKQAIGELWAARSAGLCRFLLVGKTEMETALRSAAR
jgi:type III restriction enzyme